MESSELTYILLKKEHQDELCDCSTCNAILEPISKICKNMNSANLKEQNLVNE